MVQGNIPKTQTRWLIEGCSRHRSGLKSKAGAHQTGHTESSGALVLETQTLAQESQLWESLPNSTLSQNISSLKSVIEGVFTTQKLSTLQIRAFSFSYFILFYFIFPECWLLNICQHTTAPRAAEVTCGWVLVCLSVSADILVSHGAGLQADGLSLGTWEQNWGFLSLCSMTSLVAALCIACLSTASNKSLITIVIVASNLLVNKKYMLPSPLFSINLKHL